MNSHVWHHFLQIDQEALSDAIDATPEQLDLCTPHEAGRLDALDSLELDPMRHGLITVWDAEQYVLGFREGADTLDYEDDVEEREFIRFGGA